VTYNAVLTIAKNVRGPVIAGLCRAIPQDIEQTWEALKYAETPRIHTFLATSDIHMKYKLQKSRAEVLAQAVEAVRYARRLCSDVEFSAEDASRSDMDFLVRIVTGVIRPAHCSICRYAHMVPRSLAVLSPDYRIIPNSTGYNQYIVIHWHGVQFPGRADERRPPGGVRR
jgi:isopropylmalate/homocitrate/citramalate synthase